MRYSRILFGGIAATAVMSIFMMSASIIHLPALNAGVMLGALFGNSEIAGWIAHLVIGISFSFLYALLFNGWLPVINPVARGAIYGIIVFVFSEMVFTVINLLGFYSWDMKESMAMTVFSNMLACFVYGMVLGGVLQDFKIENPLEWEKKKYLKFDHPEDKHSWHMPEGMS